MVPYEKQSVYKPPPVTLFSGTVTANGNTADIDVSNYTAMEIELKVTSVSGTSPSLSVYIEGKFEATGDYKVLASQTGITGTGVWFFTINPLIFRYIRVRWVVGGTNPSFTFIVTAQMSRDIVPLPPARVLRTFRYAIYFDGVDDYVINSNFAWSALQNGFTIMLSLNTVDKTGDIIRHVTTPLGTSSSATTWQASDSTSRLGARTQTRSLLFLKALAGTRHTSSTTPRSPGTRRGLLVRQRSAGQVR